MLIYFGITGCSAPVLNGPCAHAHVMARSLSYKYASRIETVFFEIMSKIINYQDWKV